MSRHRPPRTADELRQSFIDFFAARDHTPVPSASLIPHDPTRAVQRRRDGAVQAVLRRRRGAAVPPAVSSQKCVRAGGKHNDLDDVGRTKRHLVFFEMLGNFSFGDYFKELAIPLQLGARHRGVGLRRRPHLDHRPRERRRGREDLARRRRRADGAHPAPRRQGQLLADGRHRPVRSVQRAAHRPRPGVRPRRRPAQRPARRPVHGVLEPRLHAVRPGARRHPHAAAEAADRHRRRARADPVPAAGRRRGLGDRPDGAADRRRRAR